MVPGKTRLVPVAVAQPCDVVDAVEQRHHDAPSQPLLGYGLKRGLQHRRGTGALEEARQYDVNRLEEVT